MTTSERMSRPNPKRDAPHRGMPPGSEPYSSQAPISDADVSEVIAHAVRVGYQVIGENIQQGKAAADRMTTGDFAVGDVPGELTQLSLRLLQLTRELSTTAFDLIGAAIRDPNLQTAVRGLSQAVPAAMGAATSSVPRAPRGGSVPLTVTIVSDRHVVAEPTTLRHPEQATSLTVAALASPNAALPTIRNVSFAPSADGKGLAATIVVPHEQPAGTYSGVVSDSKTHQALGMITVQVMP